MKPKTILIYLKSNPRQKDSPSAAVMRTEPLVARDLTLPRRSLIEEMRVGFKRCWSVFVNVRRNMVPEFSSTSISSLHLSSCHMVFMVDIINLTSCLWIFMWWETGSWQNYLILLVSPFSSRYSLVLHLVHFIHVFGRYMCSSWRLWSEMAN